MICPNCGKQAGEGRCPACGAAVSRLQAGLGDRAFVRFADERIGDGLSFAGPRNEPAPAAGGAAEAGPEASVRPAGPDYGRLMRLLVALDVAAVSALAVLILCLLLFMR